MFGTEFPGLAVPDAGRAQRAPNRNPREEVAKPAVSTRPISSSSRSLRPAEARPPLVCKPGAEAEESDEAPSALPLPASAAPAAAPARKNAGGGFGAGIV